MNTRCFTGFKFHLWKLPVSTVTRASASQLNNTLVAEENCSLGDWRSTLRATTRVRVYPLQTKK